jgi:protein phosphatase
MKPIDPTRLDALVVGQDTHQGETGKNNEDSGGFFAYQISDRNSTAVYVGVVADGIGGHQAGERASQVGIATIDNHFRQVSSPLIKNHLQEAFQVANAQIVNEGQTNPKFRGMGTTMTAAVMMNRELYVANVGDSRAYLIRNGLMRQLSVDHTWAQEAIEAGRLTPAEARQHPNRNVIKRYLGIQSAMEVDFRMAHPDDATQAPSDRNQGFSLKDGDTILLCSDGLSDMILDEEILREVLSNPPQEAAEQLVLRAREAGGYDNITVVIMQLPGKKAPAAPKRKRRGLPIVGALLALAFVAVLAVLAVFALPTVKELFGGNPTATLAPQATVPAPATVAPAPTETPAPAPTSTVQQAAPTALPTAAATETPAPTGMPTGEATPTGVPTRTPTHTPTPRPTWTPSPPPTATSIPSPTSEAPTSEPGPGPGPTKEPTQPPR